MESTKAGQSGAREVGKRRENALSSVARKAVGGWEGAAPTAYLVTGRKGNGRSRLNLARDREESGEAAREAGGRRLLLRQQVRTLRGRARSRAPYL